MQLHRREWFCNDCSETFPDQILFEKHLEDAHPELCSGGDVSMVARRCERARGSEEPCTLCREVVTAAEIRRHLAHHMRELALVTLSNMHDETKNKTEFQATQAVQDIDQNHRPETAIFKFGTGAIRVPVPEGGSGQSHMHRT